MRQQRQDETPAVGIYMPAYAATTGSLLRIRQRLGGNSPVSPRQVARSSRRSCSWVSRAHVGAAADGESPSSRPRCPMRSNAAAAAAGGVRPRSKSQPSPASISTPSSSSKALKPSAVRMAAGCFLRPPAGANVPARLDNYEKYVQECIRRHREGGRGSRKPEIEAGEVKAMDSINATGRVDKVNEAIGVKEVNEVYAINGVNEVEEIYGVNEVYDVNGVNEVRKVREVKASVVREVRGVKGVSEGSDRDTPTPRHERSPSHQLHETRLPRTQSALDLVSFIDWSDDFSERNEAEGGGGSLSARASLESSGGRVQRGNRMSGDGGGACNQGTLQAFSTTPPATLHQPTSPAPHPPPPPPPPRFGPNVGIEEMRRAVAADSAATRRRQRHPQARQSLKTQVPVGGQTRQNSAPPTLVKSLLRSASLTPSIEAEYQTNLMLTDSSDQSSCGADSWALALSQVDQLNLSTEVSTNLGWLSHRLGSSGTRLPF